MTFAVDFDGTLLKDNARANVPLFKKLIELRQQGHKLILWTCREDEPLQEAIKFCKTVGLEFDAINELIPDGIYPGFGKRKVYADYYIDDKAITPGDFLRKYDDDM